MRICVPETAFVENCRPNTKGSHTGRSIKESWDASGVYLSIHFLFYLFSFFLFFVRMFLECKDVED